MKWNPLKSRKQSLLEDLKNKNKQLEKVSSENKGVFSRSSEFFKNLFNRVSLDEDAQEQVEELLLGLDFGVGLSSYISKRVAARDWKEVHLSQALKEELLSFYGEPDVSLNIKKGRTNILLIVGPNGSGKTTTIAKLSYWFQQKGSKVLIIAGDTFRAGAVDQLKTWADRLGIDIVVPEREKEDPASLVYKGLSDNTDKKYDLVICDTSGRNHSNQNLLKELKKIYEVIAKFDTSAPHETLLVMDSVMGQTSLLQADKFLEYAKVTGIVLTKMDYMSRGGIIFSIKDKFGIPVKFIGVGEALSDLEVFNLENILKSWTSELSN